MIELTRNEQRVLCEVYSYPADNGPFDYTIDWDEPEDAVDPAFPDMLSSMEYGMALLRLIHEGLIQTTAWDHPPGSSLQTVSVTLTKAGREHMARVLEAGHCCCFPEKCVREKTPDE